MDWGAVDFPSIDATPCLRLMNSHSEKLLTNHHSKIAMEKVFTDIYENRLWGNNQSLGYNGSSGPGSEVAFNELVYIPVLKNFISTHNIKTIVDLGCGDFKCGPLLYRDLDIKYTGYDVYQKVLDHNRIRNSVCKYQFKHLDFFNRKDEIVNSDLCILKDVIQHWALGDIYYFMDFLVYAKKSKYLILCNCGYQMHDDTEIECGGFRPLSCKFLPLRKYNISELFSYNSKEVSVLQLF